MRLATRGDVETTLAPGKHARKPLLQGANLLPLRVGQIRVRRREIAGTAMRLNDANLGQLVRILERKRGQADGIEQLKDGSVGADAERECEHRNRCETWVIAQHAQGVAEILQRGGHSVFRCTESSAEASSQMAYQHQNAILTPEQ